MVGTDDTHFQSTTPVAYIDKNRKVPYRIMDYFDQTVGIKVPDNCESNYINTFEFARRYFANFVDKRNSFEEKFLTLYWKFIYQEVSRKYNLTSSESLDGFTFLYALLPIPQAHIYVPDPLDVEWPRKPPAMYKLDFAFWTGDHLVGVEIDGWEPSGYSADVQRNRRLHAAGVEIIHMLNTEIDKLDTVLIERLFPRPVINFLPKGRWSIFDIPSCFDTWKYIAV
jgi:hypothetical protein